MRRRLNSKGVWSYVNNKATNLKVTRTLDGRLVMTAADLSVGSPSSGLHMLTTIPIQQGRAQYEGTLAALDHATLQLN